MKFTRDENHPYRAFGGLVRVFGVISGNDVLCRACAGAVDANVVYVRCGTRCAGCDLFTAVGPRPPEHTGWKRDDDGGIEVMARAVSE